MKKIVYGICAAIVLLAMPSGSYAQQQQQQEVTISGTVDEIAGDGTYIVVNGQKIMTSPDFNEYSNMETGDEVSVVVEQNGDMVDAVDYDYL